MGLWWLSFVDPKKAAPPDEQVPGGPGFLGVAIVRAGDEADGGLWAVQRSWALGLNPGGEVGIYGPFPEDEWPAECVERATLLTAEEASKL